MGVIMSFTRVSASDLELAMKHKDCAPLALDGYSGWDPEDVAHTAELLGATPFDTLAAHYDPAAMDALGVYPRIWLRDGNDGLGYLRENYAGLVEVFAHAARHQAGLLQTFG